ncbi:MAG: Ig-like domain-containing protein [Lutibacter sp.]
MKKRFFFDKNKQFFLLSIFILIFNNPITYSQCTNTTPTGSPSQSFCKVDNPTITDLVANGGTIVWYDASVGGNQYATNDPLTDGVTYYADDINNGGCSISRLAVTVSINGDVPQNVDVYVGKCKSQNPTIADLNATGTNIQWYDAQTGGNLLSSTDLLVDGQTYWVQQTENGCTSSRLPTTVSLIDPTPPTVPPTQTFCSPPNPTVADLAATGTNIVWYDTETSATPLSSTTPLVNGEDYWAVENSFPCESTTRVQTVVQIDTAPDAGTSGSLDVCEIDLTTTNLFSLLGGTPETTGTWTGPSTLSNGYLGTFEPGTNVEGTYTYTVSSTNGICPDASANVTVIINTTPPPTISQSNQTFCEIDNATVGDLAVTGNNVQWYDTQTSTTPLNTSDPLINGEDYWASDTNTSTGCESATRTVVNVTINTTPPPTIAQTNQTFCEIDNATVGDLTVTGNNVQWFDTQTSTTPLNASDLLIDGEDYWASDTNTSTGCESATRTVVNVTINTTPPPTTSQTNQTFCEIDNATVGDLAINGNNVQWYDTIDSTVPLNPADLLVDGEDYWASDTNTTTGCVSASRTVVNVTINATPPPTTNNTTQTFCMKDFSPGSPTIADLQASGNSILWYDSDTSTTPLNSTDVLVDGRDYWASDTNTTTGCESAQRTMVTVVLINPITPTTSNTNQTFCVAQNPTIADLQVSGSNIVWYDNQNDTSPLSSSDALIDGEDYWAASTDATTGCESINRVQITVSLLDEIPVTISQSLQTFCATDVPTVENLQPNGNNIVWYDSETSTAPLSINEVLADGEDYWAVQTNANGCESSSRQVVTVSLTDAGEPNIAVNASDFCKLDNPTLADLNARVTANSGNTLTWYDNFPGGNVLSLNDPLVEGATYYVSQTDSNGCSTINPVGITVSLEACQQYDIIIYDGFSPTGDGINDSFKIVNLKALYPNFKVEFFNRWGKKIYSQNASKPDWNGRLNGNGNLVPAGVYYFIIYFNKDGRKPIQRRLYISR